MELTRTPRGPAPALTDAQSKLAADYYADALRLAAKLGRRHPSGGDLVADVAWGAVYRFARSWRPDARNEPLRYLNHCVSLAWVDELRASLGRRTRKTPRPDLVPFSVVFGEAPYRTPLEQFLPEDAPAPGADLEAVDEVLGLTRTLPRKLRVAVRYLYLCADTAVMKKTGKAMGLSEGRISQIVDEAHSLLRERLGPARNAG